MKIYLEFDNFNKHYNKLKRNHKLNEGVIK